MTDNIAELLKQSDLTLEQIRESLSIIRTAIQTVQDTLEKESK